MKKTLWHTLFAVIVCMAIAACAGTGAQTTGVTGYTTKDVPIYREELTRDHPPA